MFQHRKYKRRLSRLFSKRGRRAAARFTLAFFYSALLLTNLVMWLYSAFMLAWFVLGDNQTVNVEENVFRLFANGAALYFLFSGAPDFHALLKKWFPL